jgi:hypothetical protein
LVESDGQTCPKNSPKGKKSAAWSDRYLLKAGGRVGLIENERKNQNNNEKQ